MGDIERFGGSRRWLSYALLLFGTVLILAGVVFFFAFNWDRIPVMGKFAVVVCAFVCCLAAVSLAPVKPAVGQLLTLCAGVLIGVFLAVYGQVYQTGADPWQLFALWALLMTPLVVLARSQVGWVFWAGLGATGLVLFLTQHLNVELFRAPWTFGAPALVAFYVGAVWAGLEFWRKERAAPWLDRIWSRLVFAVVVFGALAAGIVFILVDAPVEAGGVLVGFMILTAVTVVVGMVFGGDDRDISVLGIGGLAWLVVLIALGSHMMSRASFSFEAIVFWLGCLTIGATTGLVLGLHRLARSAVSADDAMEAREPRFRITSIIVGFGAWLSTLCFLGLLAAMGVLTIDPDTLLVAIPVGIGAAVLARMKLAQGVFLAQIVLAASLLAQLGVLLALVETGALEWGVLIAGAALYWAIATPVHRFLTALLMGTVLFSNAFFLESSPRFVLLYVVVLTVTAATFGAKRFVGEALREALLPGAYAAALIALVVSHPILMNLMDGPVTAIGRGVLAITAVVLLSLGYLEPGGDGKKRRFVEGAAALVVSSLFTTPGVLCALVLLGLGLWQARLSLTVIATVGLGMHLGFYYYDLEITLLMKSLALMGSGAMLLGLWRLWDLGEGSEAGPVTSIKTKARWILTTGVAVVLIFGALIIEKETFIARGDTIFFELAPIDPRSLMQGDYMTLRYAAGGDIERLLDSELTRRGKVVVAVDPRGVATVDRLDDGTYGPDERPLKWKRRDRAILIGPNGYFFQEGRAEHFDQAKYAELKVDRKGNTLLVRLRDGSMEPL